MMRFYFMGMQGSFISTQKPSTTAAAAIVHFRKGYAHVFEKAGKFGILQFKKYVCGEKAARTVRNDSALIWNGVEFKLKPLALMGHFFL